MTLSTDGKTLFASDPTAAYSWTYDAFAGTAEHQSTVVSGMNTDDHTTRTLIVSQKLENTLLISRGSTSNIDPLASNISTGHSQIKAFDLGLIPTDGYQFDTDGLRLGYVHFGDDLSHLVPSSCCQTCLGSTFSFFTPEHSRNMFCNANSSNADARCA